MLVNYQCVPAMRTLFALWVLCVELRRDVKSMDVGQAAISRLVKEKNVLAIQIAAHPGAFNEMKQTVGQYYSENPFVTKLEFFGAGVQVSLQMSLHVSPVKKGLQ